MQLSFPILDEGSALIVLFVLATLLHVTVVLYVYLTAYLIQIVWPIPDCRAGEEIIVQTRELL